MTTVKVSQSPLTAMEIADGATEVNHIIKGRITNYDENESWKLTHTRAIKTAGQLFHMHKATRVIIDMPRTFTLHLAKQLGSYPNVEVVIA